MSESQTCANYLADYDLKYIQKIYFGIFWIWLLSLNNITRFLELYYVSESDHSEWPFPYAWTNLIDCSVRRTDALTNWTNCNNYSVIFWIYIYIQISQLNTEYIFNWVIWIWIQSPINWNKGTQSFVCMYVLYIHTFRATSPMYVFMYVEMRNLEYFVELKPSFTGPSSTCICRGRAGEP
jgi:hypothetical protein